MANTSYQYQASTGVVNISTANPNLDGTGALGLVIAGAIAPNTAVGGTAIKRIIVKATETTVQGMIRLFKFNGTNYFLVKEINVPPITQSNVLPAFSAGLRFPLTLNPGEVLFASTQNGQSFNIIAEGVNFGSCPCSANADGKQSYYQRSTKHYITGNDPFFHQ
jgi:hypothetical protein